MIIKSTATTAAVTWYNSFELGVGPVISTVGCVVVGNVVVESVELAVVVDVTVLV